MIRRAYDVYPADIARELIKLAKRDPNWVDVKVFPNGEYAALPKYWSRERLLLARLYDLRGGDVFAMWAASRWLADGPKVFRPTAEQCAALEQVEVSLTLRDYRQPYSTLYVEFPAGRYAPFNGCVVFHTDDREMVNCDLRSSDENRNIVTTIRRDERPMERSIQAFDESCADDREVASVALRVAINSCLALCNFGHVARLAFPGEVERDRKWSREQSERGARARERVHTAVTEVSFAQDVKLHSDLRGRGSDGDHAGAERPFHWRRGHMRAKSGYGDARRAGEQVPLVYVRPCMVRADKLTVDVSETSVEYSR